MGENVQKSSKIRMPRELDFISFEDDFLEKINKKIQIREKLNRLIFDFSKTEYTGLMEILCLSIAADYLHKEKDCTSSFYLPKKKVSRFRSFLVDWNIVNVLSKKGTFNFNVTEETERKYRVEKFMGARSFSSRELSDVKNDLLSSFKSNFPEISDKGKSSLSNNIVFEICQNAMDHAYEEDEIPNTFLIATISYPNYIWIMENYREKREGAQRSLLKLPEWFRNIMRYERECKNFLEIVVVDGGRGMAENLKIQFREKIKKKLSAKGEKREPFPYEYRDKNIVENVILKGGLSSHKEKERDPRRGYGLFWMRKHVETWGGCVILYTGKCKSIISTHGHEFLDRKFDFPGVQYKIFLPVLDREKELEELFSKQYEWECEIAGKKGDK